MRDITTVTGKHFDPTEPEKQPIDLEDIAHALSLICRGNGRTKHFYSVAQHCIDCAEEAEARGCTWEVILGCLLHDAGEAYLCDETRPIKKQMPRYLAAEEKLQNEIWKRFIGRQPNEDERKKIFEIDDLMLSMEFHRLMPEELNGEYTRLANEVTCEYREPREVRERFLRMAAVLRVRKYESRFDEARRLLRSPRSAEDDQRLRRLAGELAAYYESADWRKDFEADEAGLLPENLKRGVLSEDGIYDLLEEVPV